MKNNYRIINILRRVFVVFFWLATAHLILGGLIAIVDLIFGMRNLIDLPLKFGECGINSINFLTYDSFLYRLHNSIYYLIFSVCLFFIFKNASEIFVEMQKMIFQGDFFVRDNYYRIRKCGLFIIVLIINDWVYEIIKTYIIFRYPKGDKVEFHIQFDGTVLLPVILVFIILVFAEMYRVGIEMKEESDYTI